MSVATVWGILALALAGGPAEGAHSLTLKEAIDMALAKNEGLLIERESFGAATAAVSSARGAYDPFVEMEGAWSRSTEPVNSSLAGAIAPENESTGGRLAIRQLLPTGGALSLRAEGARGTTEDTYALLSPAYDTRVGVDLRQPLLRGRSSNAARLSVRVAGADREGAKASLRRAITETVAGVERTYWVLVEARLDVDVREQAVALAQEQLTQTQARVATGSAPQTELAQPRAELERRRGALLASREALARAENALKVLILDGSDDALWTQPLDAAEDATLEVGPVDVAASLTRALASRPELEIANAVVTRRRAETSFARDAVRPSLDAVASFDKFGLSGRSRDGSTLPPDLEGGFGESIHSLGRGDYDAARVALVLGFPVGNRAARGDAAVADHRERQAAADVIRVQKAIRAEVLDAAAALETTGQRIEAARSGREAAEIQLSAERDRYATGLSTNFLVLTRQNDLSRARLDEISALTDYRIARTEMARATGSLIEERGIDGGGTKR